MAFSCSECKNSEKWLCFDWLGTRQCHLAIFWNKKKQVQNWLTTPAINAKPASSFQVPLMMLWNKELFFQTLVSFKNPAKPKEVCQNQRLKSAMASIAIARQSCLSCSYPCHIIGQCIHPTCMQSMLPAMPEIPCNSSCNSDGCMALAVLIECKWTLLVSSLFAIRKHNFFKRWQVVISSIQKTVLKFKLIASTCNHCQSHWWLNFRRNGDLPKSISHSCEKWI